MFSKGQLIFALVFFIAFVVFIAMAYRKDKGMNKSLFKGSYKVLFFALFIFFALYGLVKLKHILAP
jgi:phosphatidylglycerophosphate synthase